MSSSVVLVVGGPAVPLISVSLRQFVDVLNARHALGLSERECQRADEVLKEQWFSCAEELRLVDMEILGFLPLPKQLPLAIHAFFQPDYSPNARFAPGGANAAAAAPAPLLQPNSAMLAPPSALSPHSASEAQSSNGSTMPHSRSASALPAPASSSSPFAGASSASSSSSMMPVPPGGSPSASASAASASASAFELDLATMEGGAKSEGGGNGGAGPSGEGNDHEFSVSRSGEGIDGSSSDQDDSGSDDSALRGDDDDHDPSALPVAGHKSKKKRARHSSLVALSKAVDHVCASATRDEAVISSLQNILRGAMSKAGRHTQNTLRALLQKLQDKQGAAAAGAADDLAPAMKSMSLDAGVDEQKSSAPAPVSASASSSSSSQALTSSALSPSAFASPPAHLSPSAFNFTCGICHSAQDKPVALECGHEFCRSCLSSFLNALVGAKKAVGIKCPFKPLGSASSSSVATPSACMHELSTGVIQQVLSPADFESYLNATLMSFIESDDCLTVTCPNPNCHNIMSIEPLVNPQVPAVITEKDEDGKLLTKETYLHWMEFRVRCRACNVTNFCAKCSVQPYHKGFTCAGFKEYQSSRHCRFCSAKLSTEEALRSSNGVRDVCAQAECQAKSLMSCEKTLACGCACVGIKNEAECHPCLKHDLHIDEDEYCGICYVEGLKDAPCLTLKGPCKHTFHYACLLKKLESRYPGARIGFEFKGCPLCKQEIVHPALAEVLAPINALEASIKERALQRLQFEGREKDPAIVNKDGAHYNDPVGFAMKNYLFYMCFKCKKPYFAGGYACQEANQAFDPAELICPGCQPQSVEDCAVHGRDWLAYKCRYCCSFANWYCWGTSHFCDKCHKTGVWQNLAVFRTGKNKKKLWEYEQCASLAGPVAAIGAEAGTEEEKNAKIAKLLCAPRSCALGVRHPPNGLEFGLGCSMCEDKQSLGDAAEAQAAMRKKLSAVREEIQKAGSRTFVPQSDFDMEGVFWYLGTCAKTQVWSNPADAGFVKIATSGAMEDSAPLSALVGRDLVRLVSKPVRHSWFSWELVDLQLCLTHYTLKHYNSWDTECLRHWILEGSNDGVRWDPLVTHNNDTSLDRKGGTHTWRVDSYGKKFSMFRILQTGRNSNNNFYLALSGSEMYGELSLREPPPQPLMQGGMPVAMPVQQARGAPTGLTFSPRSDFDNNGIIHYLGTNFGKTPNAWRNPMEMGLVNVACSELAAGPPPSAPTSALLGKEVVRCVSAAKPFQWFVIDLTPSGKCIKPSHYSLRHYSSWDLEALRNWRFEGSINGYEWATLSVHTNDSSLDKKGGTRTWALPGCQVICTMFRILQTGLNSNNHHYLACSGFEVYGVLEDVSPSLAQYQRELAQGLRPQFPGHGPIQPAAMMAPMAPQNWAPTPVLLNQGMQPFSSIPVPSPTAGLLLPPLPQGPPSSADSGIAVLRYSADFDQFGCMYYLGTQGRRVAWHNPAETGQVSVRASELAIQPPSVPASALCGRETVRCCTVGKQDMWFMIDLKDKMLMPTHYSLKHYITYDTEALRNWKLEGSVNGAQWDLLRVHSNDKALSLKGATATWPLQPTGRFYRMFRLMQTGPNSNNNFYMCCSGFEAYGLLQLWPSTGTADARAQQSAMQSAGWKGDPVDLVRVVQQQLTLMPQQQRGSFAAPPSQPLAAGAASGYPGAMGAAGMPPGGQAFGSQQPNNLPLLPANAAAASAAGGASPVSDALVPLGPNGGPPPYREFSDGMEFVYGEDLDKNGILYWLGTSRWTKPWVNPADLGVVQVTSVPLAIAPRSEPASAIVGRSLCRCVTLPNRESWFVIDLLTIWVRPTAYTLRHYDSWDTECLRDWKLQGSNDGKKWTKLLSHKKDESLCKKGAAKTWQIPKPKKAYRMFRILQTGKNSNNHWYCALSSMELYGKVYSFKK